MSVESFSSMPPEEERHFAIYEERSRQSAKQANMIGLVSAGGVLVLTVIIAIAFRGQIKGPDFSKEPAEAAAPAAAAAPAPAPAAPPPPAAAPTDTPPAAATPTDTAAPAGAAVPAPPPGATKAPPPH
jgi:hypothetical protein